MVVVIRPFYFGEQMTVPVSDRLSQLYVGNGTSTRFDFTFRVFDQEDENGVTVRVKNGTEFEDVDKALYQVSINQDEMGGFITFNTAPDSQTYFYVAGQTPIDQLLDITNYDNFYPDAIERALDKLTAVLQEWNHLLSSESQSRILADINYDALAQARENELKSYIDGLISSISGESILGVQFITQVETVADLSSLLKWDGRTVYVKSYYMGLGKGGGTRIYSHARRNENDGFLCINGWVLQLDQSPNAYQAGAVGDGVADDTSALQKLFNYSSPTSWGGGTTQAQSYRRNGFKVKVLKGLYRTTQSLLVGVGANIDFEGCGSFLFSENDGAVIYADFQNPFDFVIKSANYDKDGVLCPYSKFISGDELDAGLYSSTHGIIINNIQIVAKKQMFGGIKLTGAPQSKIINFYINNVDYGVALSASWTTHLIGQTLHHKCGMCAASSNHNIKYDGYFNRSNSSTLPLATDLNIIPTDILDSDKSCGVFLGSAQSATSTQLTCEYNHIGLIAYWCPTFVSSLYSEKSSGYTLAASASDIHVGIVSGFFDARNFYIVNNSSVTVDSYAAGNINNPIPLVSEYGSEKNRLSVAADFHFWSRNTLYKNFDNVIYVDPNSGSDLYTGFDKNYPCKTLDMALSIVTSVTSDGVMLYNNCTIVVNGGSHLINGVNLLNANLTIKSGNSVASVNFNIDSSFVLHNSTVEIVNFNVNVDKSYGWASYGGAGLSILILRDCVTNLSNNACILFSNTDSTTHLYIASGVINGNNSNCIAIIPSDSFATIELKCSAVVSPAILNRSDKGLNLNRDNTIKIFPISLR